MGRDHRTPVDTNNFPSPSAQQRTFSLPKDLTFTFEVMQSVFAVFLPPCTEGQTRKNSERDLLGTRPLTKVWEQGSFSGG